MTRRRNNHRALNKTASVCRPTTGACRLATDMMATTATATAVISTQTGRVAVTHALHHMVPAATVLVAVVSRASRAATVAVSAVVAIIKTAATVRHYRHPPSMRQSRAAAQFHGSPHRHRRLLECTASTTRRHHHHAATTTLGARHLRRHHFVYHFISAVALVAVIRVIVVFIYAIFLAGCPAGRATRSLNSRAYLARQT